MKKIISLILILLMLSFASSIVFAIPSDIRKSPKSFISNGLTSVNNGGTIITEEFTLGKDELLTSKMFVDKGFDQHSIIFGIDANLIGKVETKIIDEYSYAYNFGEKDLYVNARVVCEYNGNELVQTLNGLKIELKDNPLDLCGAEDFPCCAVILNYVSETENKNTNNNFDIDKIGGGDFFSQLVIMIIFAVLALSEIPLFLAILIIHFFPIVIALAFFVRAIFIYYNAFIKKKTKKPFNENKWDLVKAILIFVIILLLAIYIVMPLWLQLPIFTIYD